MRAILILIALAIPTECSAQMWDGWSWGANYGANVVGRYSRSADRFYGASRATARAKYMRATRAAKLNKSFHKYIERGDYAAAVRVLEVAQSYGLHLRSMRQAGF